MLMKVVAASAALIALTSAHANLLTNGSFEAGNFPAGASNAELAVGSTLMPGWTVTTGSLSWLSNGAFGIPSLFGDKFLDLTSAADTFPFGGVSQSFATSIGNTYLLTYELGAFSAYSASNNTVTATAGGTSLACSIGTGASSGSAGEWKLCAMSFVATGASTTLSLVGSSAGTRYIGLDDVNVVMTASAVPEPASAALLALGLAGMGSFAARRRSKA